MLNKTTSKEILRAHVEQFINVLITQGEMSFAPKSGDLNKLGTAFAIIKIMKELNQPTVPMSKIKKFEKDLTTFIKKNR